MAMYVKLVRTADFEAADIETIDLLDQDNIEIEENGWEQAIAGEFDKSAMESMTLKIVGNSHHEIAVKLNALETLLGKIGWYAESPERYGVWLRAKLAEENGYRQALLTKWTPGSALAVYSVPMSPGNKLEKYPLAVERIPLWESTSSVNRYGTNVSSVGGISSIASISGTESARVAFLKLSGTSDMNEYWGGFMTARHRTLANFVSPWELELGTALTDTALATDATGSPGGAGNTKMTVTFATTTMTPRVTLAAKQISATNFLDLRGVYDCILRAKCGSGVTASVRLSVGMPGSGSYFYCSPVSVTGTDWKFYNIGRITLPAGGQTMGTFVDGMFASSMYWSTLQIEASQTAGSGTLDLDCIVPIPVDEGHFHCSYTDVIGGWTGGNILMSVSPKGLISSYEWTSAFDPIRPIGQADTSGTTPAKCVLPNGASQIIMAGQRVAGSTLADVVNYKMYVFPRWRTLHGNDV